VPGEQQLQRRIGANAKVDVLAVGDGDALAARVDRFDRVGVDQAEIARQRGKGSAQLGGDLSSARRGCASPN
jgi:hypothetical protein